MVWSGVAGPTCESAGASSDEVNSVTVPASSKVTITRRSCPSRPRSRGASASAAARRAAGSSTGTRGPPKTRRPRFFSAIASSARVISSMVAS